MHTRAEVTPAQAATAAQDMTRYLVEHLVGQHFYSEVILDVTGGPSGFGPVPRVALKRLLLAAEHEQFPVTTPVKANAMQHLQFSSLAGDCGGKMGAVYKERVAAVAWIESKSQRDARRAPRCDEKS